MHESGKVRLPSADLEIEIVLPLNFDRSGVSIGPRHADLPFHPGVSCNPVDLPCSAPVLREGLLKPARVRKNV
jgi:hypothetical protein